VRNGIDVDRGPVILSFGGWFFGRVSLDEDNGCILGIVCRQCGKSVTGKYQNQAQHND
jgi:hypothetical protein